MDTRRTITAMDVLHCGYCRKPAMLVAGKDVYPHIPRLAEKPIWRCLPCGAWVGCHPNSTKPLGRLANAELREAKRKAHDQFDAIWKGPAATMSRSAAYSWLAGELGIAATDCHIGLFDVELCRRTVEIMRRAPR